MRLTTKLKIRIKELERELELQKAINQQARDDKYGNKVRAWERRRG